MSGFGNHLTVTGANWCGQSNHAWRRLDSSRWGVVVGVAVVWSHPLSVIAALSPGTCGVYLHMHTCVSPVISFVQSGSACCARVSASGHCGVCMADDALLQTPARLTDV